MIFSQRILSTREQARVIRREVIELVDKANEFSVGSRRINRRAAYKVISRSLSQSRDLPFSIRKHKAITDLSNYISLAKYNKVIGLTADHTDLLPISHPRSTQINALSASALVQAKIRWYVDDPRIKDDTVKSLVASAMAAPTDSAEYKYALTRLENLPASELPLEALAAAANPYAGKNSAAARRARESIQLSDRFERWLDMFGSLKKRATDGFRTYVRRNDGTTRSHSGVVLNQNMERPELIDIEVGKGKVAIVPIKSGEGLKAFIKDPDSVDGFSQTEAKPTNAPIIPEDSIVFTEAPSIYRKEDDYRGKGTKYTDDKYDIIKFDNPKDAMPLIDDSNKRAADLDKPAPKQLKLGEIDSDTGRQFWNPDEPVFAVARRGKKTNFAFTQTWKDVNNEIMLDEPDLDEEEGRDYTRPEPRTSDDTVPLIQQANKIFDGKKRKQKEDKKETAPAFPYKVPDRAYEFNPNEEYTPEFDFDDPESLAEIDTPVLEEALLRSVEPVSATERATGFAPLDLPNGDTEDVSSEAIASALRAKGQDAEMALAKAYDKIAGDTKNQDDLKASREERRADEAAKPADLEEKFDEVVKEEPEKVEPTPVSDEVAEDIADTSEGLVRDLSDEELRKIPALKGLSDEEFDKIVNDPNYDYSSVIPKIDDFDVPEGMYKPGESTAEDRLNALELAAISNRRAPNSLLESKLKEAMDGSGPELGKASIPAFDENGEQIDIPVSAETLRDAIALRGKDAAKAMKKIAKPEAEEKPAKEEKPAEEEKETKPVGTYKRSGGRTLLKDGKGKPFTSNKEVADFLAENGFEFTEKVTTKDGRELPVYAHSKQQTDEEFKSLARELRDRFGIDLKPRPATTQSPAQEEIDFDAPSPEKPAEAETPIVPPTTPPTGPEGVEEPEEEEPKLDPKRPTNVSSKNDLVNENQKIVVQDNNVFTLDGKFLGKIPEGMSAEEFLRSYYYRATRTGRDAEAIAKAIKASEKDKPYDGSDFYPTDEDERAAVEAIREQDRKNREEEEEELSNSKKDLLKQLVNERRIVQDAIDEADLSDEVKPEEKQALRDLYDKLTRAIDAIVLGEQVEDTKSPENQVADETLSEAFNDEAYKPTIQILLDKLFGRKEDKVPVGPFGSRKDMISKLMWFKWGAGFKKNESPFIRDAMTKYEKDLNNLSTEDMIDLLNLYYDEIDAKIEADRIASDRAKIIAEAKKARRKAYEDSLIEEYIRGKKGKAAKPTPEAPAAEESKKPTDSLKEGDEFYLPGVGMVKVKKVTYAPVPGRGVFVEYEDKDGNTGNTEIFDKFVETRAPEAKTEEAPATPAAESTPASTLVKKIKSRTSQKLLRRTRV